MDEPKEPKGKQPPLPPSIAAAFDALTTDAATPRADGKSGRPLLDIFPTESGARPAPRPRQATKPPAPAAPRPDRRKAPRPAADEVERFYGLREKPFTLAPDPRFFFHSRAHDAVSQQLLTAIRERAGLVVITGEAGTGKTSVCRVVLEELDRRTLTSFITDPSLTAEALLTAILCDFGVLSRDEVARRPLGTRQELSATLQSFVESLAPLDAATVVIIDDAHDLPDDALEQVRLLCEAAAATSRFQVVLVGTPSLASLLRRADYRTIQQRAAIRATLGPLGDDEIAAYIRHRLEIAGDGVHTDFEPDAIARVLAVSRGVPRTINLICDGALAHGYEASAGAITTAMVDAAAGELDLEPAGTPLGAVGRRVAIAGALLLFAAAGAAAAAWVFRDALVRALQQWQHTP